VTERRLDAIALDVDGVLTDGGFWWGPDGAEWKRFCFADVMGISRGKRAGLVFALISGEDSQLIDRFAQKLGITAIYKGCKDKGAALIDFAEREGFALDRIGFMGDDVNDLSALSLAGLSAAPANAQPPVLEAVQLRLPQRGGDGAVRAFIEHVLTAASAC
jgi:3-deoxy-D-manno-octulosonate 8-phosphate phosphatase (KDO 8-P phosphatase)